MVERLKRWESPRKQGRNDKGKGGSARARQLRKREQRLKAKLKKSQGDRAKKGGKIFPLFFWQLNFNVLSQETNIRNKTSSHLSVALYLTT